MTVQQAIDKAIKRKVEALAAFYNTWGYEHGFSRMAEQELVDNDLKLIEQARTLASQARNVM